MGRILKVTENYIVQRRSVFNLFLYYNIRRWEKDEIVPSAV